MFKELHEIAKQAPIIIRIAPEGEGLRVMIHQNADSFSNDVGDIPLALSVVGTPEQLDTELPAAIAAFTATTNDSIAEQARKQAERAVAETASAKAFAPAKAKAAPKKTAAKASPPAGKKAAPKKSAALVKRPAAKVKTPAPKAAKPVKHIPSKPTAEDCINAYLAYAVANPGDIKREAFIKGNPTGRRFERLFGNWEKFIAAAAKAGTLNPPGDNLTQPLPLETAPASEPAAAAPARTGETAEAVPPAALSAAAPETLPEVWPFPATAGATKVRAVVTTDDVVITPAIELIVETDQRITVDGIDLRVLDFNDTTIWVEYINAAETTAGATA